MSAIFSTAPGSVIKLAGNQPAIPTRVSFEFGNQVNCIVTQAAVSQQGNYQFLHSIQDFIYVYVFGDRIGEFQISGLAFGQSCQGGGQSGLLDALNYYTNNRISVRKTPVKILFAGTSGEGFLTGSRVGIANPETNLGQFAFRFNVFPQPNS